MDTETFLITRERVIARLANRRQSALEAAAERRAGNGGLFGASVPFWLRMALNTMLPKRFGGFWPQAILAAAPVVLGLAKNVAGQFRSPAKDGGILGFLPLVKSLIKRYN